MDSLTQKIIEVENLLREHYITKRSTRTKDLSKVLPTHSALKRLKKTTEDILDLWEFYRSWCFRKRLRKHSELMKPKSKMSIPKKRSAESLLEEDRAYDDKPRGYI